MQDPEDITTFHKLHNARAHRFTGVGANMMFAGEEFTLKMYCPENDCTVILLNLPQARFNYFKLN